MTWMVESADNPSSAAVVAEWLMRGEAVVVPSETVYGIAASPAVAGAIGRVFELKGRPAGKNLPVVVGEWSQMEQLGVEINASIVGLAEAFWPGPLTIVMGFREGAVRVPWLRGRSEVAVRMPGIEVLRHLAKLVGPLVLTSANLHGRRPAASLKGAIAALGVNSGFALDGGVVRGRPTTIINARLFPPRIERLGGVLPAAIADVIGDVWVEDLDE